MSHSKHALSETDEQIVDHSVRDVLLSCGTGERFGKVVATVGSHHNSYWFNGIELNMLVKERLKVEICRVRDAVQVLKK